MVGPERLRRVLNAQQSGYGSVGVQPGLVTARALDDAHVQPLLQKDSIGAWKANGDDKCKH